MSLRVFADGMENIGMLKPTNEFRCATTRNSNPIVEKTRAGESGFSASQQRLRSLLLMTLIGFSLVVPGGCKQAAPPEFRFNEVEWIKQERMRLEKDERLPDEYRGQIGTALTALFGTPDKPKFPIVHGEDDVGHEILSLDNLRMAAGAVKSNESGEPAGLYREHCAHCHGITGDGAGPTAAFLNPYPRDFRLGKFKFKSTPLLKPPTDEDLTEILRHGIPGTAMPAFTTLEPDQMAALIDYVKYLSMRGSFERRLIARVAEDPDEPLIDLNVLDMSEDDPEYEDKYDEFLDQMFVLVEDILHDEERIIDRWENPDAAISKVPGAPNEFALDADGHDDLVAQGKKVFFGPGNCIQCHGETGVGDGQTENYDDWANDWIKNIRFDPGDRETYREFVEAGAMPPRAIRPRNLRMPVFRGGGHPDDIYRRIANGIEGTPMPSAPALSADDVWALVAYVKSLPYEDQRTQSEPAVNDQAIR